MHPTDPHSGQPDSKAVPAALAPVSFAAHGFDLSRAPLSGDTVFAWNAIEGGYAARFATNEPFSAVLEDLVARSPGVEQATYNDVAQGLFRAALILGERLEAVAFSGAREKSHRGAVLPQHGRWRSSTPPRAAFF